MKKELEKMAEKKIFFEDISEEMDLPEVIQEPITRQQLVDYASASGDYNTIHYDGSMAKMAGLQGCIVHGMLSMAIIGSYITNWAKGGILKNFQIKFLGITPENSTMKIKGKVIQKYVENNERLVKVDVFSELKNKTLTTQSTAIISFQ
jgi:acyl dehydratase